MITSPFLYQSSTLSKLSLFKRLDIPHVAADEGMILYNLIRVFAVEKLRLKKNYYKRMLILNPDNIGQIRSKQVNDGSIFSVFKKYFDLLGYTNASTLSKMICVLKTEWMNSLFSFLNQRSKKYLSSQLDPEVWGRFCDLGSLVGYPKQEGRIFKQDIPMWLTNKGACSGFAYTKDRLKNVYSKILGSIHLNSEKPQFKDFNAWLFARYTWMNEGSNKHSSLQVDDEYIRTKLGVALSLDDTDLWNLISEKCILEDGLKIFVKNDEKGLKGRYVCNAPIGLYLVQKYYIDWIISHTPTKTPKLTLFQEPGYIIQVVRNLFNSLKILVPIDFDAFDTKIEYIFWDALNEWIIERCPPEISRLSSYFTSFIGRISIYDENNKRVGIWTRGLPSGLYATAFVGSLFNLTMQELISEDTGLFDPTAAQGDDGIICTTRETMSLFGDSSEVYLARIQLEFNKVCAVVNENKNWIVLSEVKPAVEYLKMVITPFSVEQYPARVFSSIAWNYPSNKPLSTYEKLISLANLWKEFFDRSHSYYENEMVSDIHGMLMNKFNWSKDLIRKWIHTPVAVGGFGLVPLDLSTRFVYRSNSKKLKAKGLIYPRYPFMHSSIWKIDNIVIDLKAILDSSKHSPKTLESLSRNRPPKWGDFVEYVRYSQGLENKLTDIPAVRDNFGNIPFRILGYSDLYIIKNIGGFDFRGITKDYLSCLLLMLRTFRSFRQVELSVQLWK